MTPHQQLSVYSPQSVADTIRFDTYSEYLEWASRKR